MTNRILNQLSSSCKKWKTLVLIGMLLTLGVGQMWADNAVTVYCAINASTMKSGDNCYTLKVNANIGDNNTWRQYTMNIVDKTKNGKLIYSATIYEKYGGVDALQFQLYQGSTWKAEKQPYSSWTTSGTFKGKMYDYDAGSWSAYSGLDDAITVYFVNTNSWATPKAFAWSGCTNNAAWSGQAMTSTDKTYNGKTIYSISFNKRYENIIFSNNGSNQTADLTLGLTNAGKMYDNGTWRTYNYDVTITFNMKGHGDAPSDITVLKGNTATAPSTPSATGYTFGGWYTNSGCTTAWNWSTAVDDNKTLYAKWTPKTTTITLDNQGATDAGSTSVTATYDADMPAITLPTKTGYIFGGYWGAPGGSGPQYYNADGTSAQKWDNTESTYKLFAKWTAITLSASISPTTINANTATAIQFTITTNAPLSSGYYFQITNWGGKNSGTAGGYNIDGDHLITTSSITHTLAAGLTNLDAGTYKIKLKITKDAVTQVESDLLTLTVSSSTYTVTVGASPAGYGTVSPASISASPDSWSGDITAAANTGYRFVNWTSSGGGITINNNTSATTQVKATSTGGTLTANFAAATYSVTLDNQDATSAGTTYVDATYKTTTLTTIIKPTKTNYTFGGYYTATGGGGIQIIDANGNWLASKSGFTDGSKKSIITENKILYAKWTETKYAVTVAVDDASHAAGNIDCSAAGWTPSKSGTAQIGNLTDVTITVPAGAAGYTYTGGSWTLTGGVTLVSGSLTSPSITVKATDAGSAIFTYAEDLSSPWVLKGGTNITGDNWATEHAMTKKTGHSTENVAYYTANISSTNSGISGSADAWSFKLIKNSEWYGLFASGSYWWGRGTSANQPLTGEQNIQICADVAGTYEIKVDYTTATPKVTVTFPTKYTVTYSVSPSGAANAITTSPSVSSGGSVAAGTSVTFTHAAANTGYSWYRWENGSGSSLGTGSTYTTTINANTTVVAKYTAKKYTVTLDLDEDHKGTTSGATTSQTVTYNAVTTTVPNRPTGAEGYGLDGYYTDHNGAGTKLINGDGTWIASVDGYTDADKKWIRDGGVTLYAYYKVGTITKLELSQSIVAPGTEITVTPTIAPLPSGTSYVCYEIQYSNGTPLPSQPEMSRSGNVVTFAAPSSSATYIVHATLRTGNSCGGGTLLSTLSTTFQVAGSHTVTVQYMCDDMVIKAATEMTGKPLEWSEEFTAPTITGYTFTRWNAGDGVTIKNGSSDPVTTTTNPTIQIKAVYDGTLTAVYSKKKMIFFYNTLGWEDVYVYFYNTDKYWSSTYGSGAKKTQAFDGDYKPYWEEEHGHMTQIEGTNIWYFDYTEAGYTTRTNVVFTEANQHDSQWFWKTKAVRRGDHKSSLPMFVPLADQTADVHNQTNYYNHGYWMNYPENTGYTLKIYNAWNATKETGAVREFPFPYSADKKMPLKMDVEFNDAGTHEYWFMVYRNDGVYMGNSYEFKQGYNDEQVITGGNNKSKLITSASGNYTFTLTYHEKGGSNDYFIDVDYPIASNDYRIVYNDRVKWSSNTAHTASWYHPSDIIRQIKNGATEPKKDTVSFYISKAAGANASMKFQKASVTGEGVITWTDVASGTIDIPSSVTESGVYNFIVSQPVGGGSIALEKVEPYTGSYYIRTDCAGSTKWDSYKATDHQMTFSDYTKAHEGYTHYYAHWAERGTNVKFVIANDYSPFVSDTLTKDVNIDFKNMDENGTLKSEGSGVVPYQDRYSANIRFMYNEQTNKLSRAYLASSTDISKKFLVMRGNSAAAKGHIFTEDGKELTDAAGGHVAGLDEYEMNFADDQNFIYETVIKANPTALIKLYAKYCGRSQEFKGDTTATFDANHAVEILGGTYAADTKEKMRIVYDFKTNRLVCAWLPSGDITGELDINADVMIIREHQGDAQQIKFTTNESKLDEVKTVYGVMRFNRWTLNNKDKSTHDPVGDPKSQYERALYWISFPFNVNLSDVFGFGTYGEDWIIEYYDGAARAAEGYWIDSPGFWRYVWPAQRATFKLEAGKGYVLALDLDRMKDNNTNFWTNNIEQIELFFPSATEAGSIKETEAIISVAEHECTIDRRTDKTAYDIDKDRTKADSHWNMIGVPSYANYGTSLTSDGSTVVTWNRTPYTQDLPFLYEWNMVDDSYTVQSGTTYPFKSMYAYMVQYHGKLYWSLASATPSSIIARRAYAQAPQEVEFKLELQQNEQMVDQTFVKLSDKEEVSANFNFDEDLCKEFNRGKANIYTIVETYIPVAGNILPLSEQTTLVPVGVKTNADGDYTFSMPNGTDGVGVTLIDGVTGERTNLALTDYTVSLEKGTYDQRFVLEISPIEHTTTAIENSEKTDAPNTVCKKLIDGVLYIIKDGKVFDARGARLQ